MSARLSSLHRRTLRALGDTFFPASGQGEPAGGLVVPDGVAELLACMEPHRQRTFKLLLTVFELGAVVRHGRPFSLLGAQARDRYVEAWMRSRIAGQRAAFRGLRQACGMAYYQDARTWGFLGYAGPRVQREAASERAGAGAGAGGEVGRAGEVSR